MSAEKTQDPLAGMADVAGAEELVGVVEEAIAAG